MSNRTISTMFTTSTTTSVQDASSAINGFAIHAIVKPHSDLNALVAALANVESSAQGAGESTMLAGFRTGSPERSEQPVSEPGRSACGAPVLIE